MVNTAPDTTGARLDFPGPSGARESPCGGDLEITKAVFGFKGESKNFSPDLDRPAGALRPRGQGALTTIPFVGSYLRARRTARSSLCICFSQRAFSACERFFNAARSGSTAWSKKPAQLIGLQLSRQRPRSLLCGGTGGGALRSWDIAVTI
jgi:hypothetical protein